MTIIAEVDSIMSVLPVVSIYKQLLRYIGYFLFARQPFRTRWIHINVFLTVSLAAPGCTNVIPLGKAVEDAQPYLDGEELAFANKVSRGLFINFDKFFLKEDGTINCPVAALYATRQRLILEFENNPCHEYSWRKSGTFRVKEIKNKEVLILPAEEIRLDVSQTDKPWFYWFQEGDRYQFNVGYWENDFDTKRSKELCAVLGLSNCDRIRD